jgi:hypothetical protein
MSISKDSWLIKVSKKRKNSSIKSCMGVVHQVKLGKVLTKVLIIA